MENDYQQTIHTQKQCIKIVAGMIKDGTLNDDPSLLWLDSKSQYHKDDRYESDLTYYEQQARMYLENSYNTVSLYTSSETLLYLAWKYIWMNGKTNPKEPKMSTEKI